MGTRNANFHQFTGVLEEYEPCDPPRLNTFYCNVQLVFCRNREIMFAFHFEASSCFFVCRNTTLMISLPITNSWKQCCWAFCQIYSGKKTQTWANGLLFSGFIHAQCFLRSALHHLSVCGCAVEKNKSCKTFLYWCSVLTFCCFLFGCTLLNSL